LHENSTTRFLQYRWMGAGARRERSDWGGRCLGVTTPRVLTPSMPLVFSSSVVTKMGSWVTTSECRRVAAMGRIQAWHFCNTDTVTPRGGSTPP